MAAHRHRTGSAPQTERHAGAFAAGTVRPAVLAGLVVLALACSGGSSPEGIPPELAGHNVQGTSLLSQQKWEEAQEHFRVVLRERPDDPVPRVNMAVALMQQGKLDEAEQHLRRAIEADPEHLHAHYDLGLVERNRGNLEAAVDHFARVVEGDPDDVLARYNLATSLSRIGRADDAIRHFRAALERDPTHVSSLYGLGRLLVQRGREEEGAELIARSQQVRAQSGVGPAVGNQYGEQGPYAMAVDYPSGGLAPPEPVPVTLRVVSWETAPRPRSAVAPWTVGTSRSGDVELYQATAEGITAFGASENPRRVAPAPPSGRPILALAAGDVDGEEPIELVVLLGSDEGRDRPFALAVVGSDGAWPEPSALPWEASGPDSTAAITLVDRDHDGDLDVFGCRGEEARARCFLVDNDASGRFRVDSPVDVGEIRGTPVRLAFSDVDNDRDIDLLAATPESVRLFANLRERFEDLSAKTGLDSVRGGHSLEPTDPDKDGWMDLVVGTRSGPVVIPNRRGRFQSPVRPAGEETPGDGGEAVPATVVLDYDNDGFLDLLGTGDDGRPRVFRNLGPQGWEETTSTVAADAGLAGLAPMAAADVDDDGDADVFARTTDGRVAWLANDGGNENHWLEVIVRGDRDNHFAVGTKVEVLAGPLRQKFEVGRPVPLLAGLGRRERADAVRLLWPGGVLQDELDPPARAEMRVGQLDRKGTSCPLLYARRAGRWEFVTDFLGGCAIGYRVTPDVLSTPDTNEYVKIEGGLTPEDGRLLVRVNNQLQEVIWFDKVGLVAVDHPAGTEAFPNERLMPGPPWPEFRVYASDDLRPLVSATEVETGRDVTRRLRERDRVYADGFALEPFKGYAEPHTLELDLGRPDASRRLVLLLDGWIDYADSTANVAASQAGLHLVPPRLEVADGRGGWTAVEGRMGFPAGLPKTMVVDLSGVFASNDHRIRLFTNMRIYWDRVRLMVGGERTPVRVRRLEPVRAELRFGGFPAETSPDGRPPFAYDPERVSPVSPWRAHAGDYTPFGDVVARVLEVDDRFVTTRAGDEIELAFPAPPPPGEGWTRTYLLHADGFGKDMDLNSAANTHVGPIPFHGMPTYPYAADLIPPNLEDATPPDARRVVP